ncbi:gliding motility-associated C-terminal domain-containing protein, partial [Myroides sp. WP-1]|uniref:gliding motility-associated C-terminal domain-containing protein n=1 Tax=Myroides sp. WP-1 TaxID=2759944 RepID=UPI0015F9EA26
AQQQLWVDEGGVVDMSSKEITTVSAVKGYGFFTLATVKKDWILDGDIVIYNLVTPDGDGKNDYFIIDNIKKYPNNTVEIYNRWGVRVYETKGYDPSGDGSSNVFRGYSEGRVTVDKNKKLPSGTYYYVVTYEYQDASGSRMIKKAANLHLETN